MASKTALTTLRREIRHDNAGRKARNARENKGTTPPFPVHTAEADANEAEKRAK
ncbi:hypothetical protein LBMAG42_42280 [Deltaproteobacteria bacterium]|nr:hypothetical protein LBMAG42_42280 [Deltaproteobacteria bacterium]